MLSGLMVERTFDGREQRVIDCAADVYHVETVFGVSSQSRPQREAGFCEIVGRFDVSMRGDPLRMDLTDGGQELNRLWHIVFILLVLGLRPGAWADSVRRVDISEAPEMTILAEHARQLGNETYPKVLALLAEHTRGVPHQFDIAFKRCIESGNIGQARGQEIQLDSQWFTGNPADVDAVLIHEMSHIAQQYKPNVPVYWTEGIADYMCYRLGYTNAWGCPQCSAAYPHYTSGYACAGAFLLYLEATFGSKVIYELNRELRRGSYSRKFFPKTTGRNLEVLWAAFQKTSAFTPEAGEINRLRKALRYVEDRPPKDLAARLRHLPAGKLSLEAGEYLKTLVKQHRLPGLLSGERGQLTAAIDPINLLKDPGIFPFNCHFTCVKSGDRSQYHYLVARASQESDWILQKAWRTSPDGRIIQEYPVQ